MIGLLSLASPTRERNFEDNFCAEGALYRRANDRYHRFRFIPCRLSSGILRNATGCAVQVCKYVYRHCVCRLLAALGCDELVHASRTGLVAQAGQEAVSRDILFFPL